MRPFRSINGGKDYADYTAFSCLQNSTQCYNDCARPALSV